MLFKVIMKIVTEPDLQNRCCLHETKFLLPILQNEWSLPWKEVFRIPEGKVLLTWCSVTWNHFFNTFFIGWKIFALQYWLVPDKHQHESVRGIHMSPPSGTSLPSSTPSHPSRLSQNKGWWNQLFKLFYSCFVLFFFFFLNNMGSEYCIINQNRSSLIQGQL